MREKLIVIVGPTAVGKTAVAIEVAKHFDTEIISADSRQFYRELNIGTAKPSADQLREVKHHFVNNKSLDEIYTVGDFEREALTVLDELFRRKNVVVMTGGSGLFIDTVCTGMDVLPSSDEGVRDEIAKMEEQGGIEALRAKLKELDRVCYDRIDLGNKRRIIRALEVCMITGKPYSSLLTRKRVKRNFDCIYVGLNLPRQELYERIESRVDAMIEEGLVDEVSELTGAKNKNALNTVGYSEIFDYFSGKYNLKEAIDKIKQHSKNYAKRQLTWFRRNSEIKWFHPGDIEEIKLYIKNR